MTEEPSPEDDLGPLAPVLYGDEEPQTPPEDEADGGVSDSDGIVRVWLEDGKLTKVRVSPLWHTRLGKRSLSDCFAQALRMANARVAEPAERAEPTFDDAAFSRLPRLSSRALAVMENLFAEVEERWDEAIERHNSRRPGNGTPVEGRSKGVSVTLNESGLAQDVAFDEKWLDSVQAGAICEHVVLAAQHAYGRFVPAEDDRGELDAIEEEHQLLMATFKAMLDPKE